MTIKNLITYFRQFTTQHPILKTFSWGNLSDYSREDYITEYPAIHFVPQPSSLGNTSQDITFSVLVYDLLNEYVDNPINSNQLDSMALCEEIMGDFYNYFVNQLSNYGYYLQTPVQYSYFTDRFAESVCGVEAQITITIEQTACIPPFIVPCPDEPIEQYLTTTITGDTIVLDLYSDSGTTSGTTALCNYSYSGVARGDLGTLYYFTGFIQEEQSSKTIDTSSFFTLSGETLTDGGLLDITTTNCDCPTNINFTAYTPTYITEYQSVLDNADLNGFENPTLLSKISQNNFVVELKTEGYWDLLQYIWLFNGEYDNAGFDRINFKTPTNLATLYSQSGYGYPYHESGKGLHFDYGNEFRTNININNIDTGVHFGIWVYDVVDNSFGNVEKFPLTHGSSLPPRNGLNNNIGSHRFPALTAVPVASSADMSGNGFRMMGNSGDTTTNGVITFTRDNDELYYNGLTYSSFIRQATRLNYIGNISNPYSSNWICSSVWSTTRGLNESERLGLRTIFQKYLTTA